MFLCNKLIPFYTGPKLTSRMPPQLEVTLFVRGTWRIPLDGPLELVDDPIEQGFMTGDVFAEDDVERTGALLYASDFADFKLNAEVLLKGTCHAPRGQALERATVSFSVGSWSKSLNVSGPHVYEKGLLLGGKVSAPQPFTSMPLTWENAYGGEDYAQNPVGRGFRSEELPTVEYADQVANKSGLRSIAPATYLAINPNWESRVRKRGKKYGRDYQENRAPFFSEDFDWTYFQSAADDQQIDGYLRGDEKLVFTNMHPEAARIETQLPGQRVRYFLKYTDQRFVEVEMNLDTLYVDMDKRTLNLTWRGLAPIEHREFEDIACGQVAVENMADPPLSLEHYRELLEKFEADPVGLNDKFPDGFLEMGARVEAEEAAELAGSPVPMDERVDPFGIRAAFPAGMLASYEAGEDIPPNIKSQFPDGFLELNESLKVGEVPTPPGLEGREELALLEEGELLALTLAPPEERLKMFEQLAQEKGQAATGNTARNAMGFAETKAPEQTLFGLMGTSLSVPPPVPRMPPIPDDMSFEDPRPMLEALSEELEHDKQHYIDKGIDHPLMALFEKGQRIIANASAMAAGMLDNPTPMSSSVDLDEVKAKLTQVEDKFGDNLKPDPDDPPEIAKTKAHAVARLEKSHESLERLAAAFPGKPPEVHDDERDFFEQDLRDHDFSGQDLSGKSFTKANLGGAKFAGATLAGAIFRETNLSKADLSGANLSNARFREAALLQADLRRAQLDGAVFARCGLGAADFREASLAGADLSESACAGTLFAKANLSGVCASKVTFRKADLTDANLHGAKLVEADFSWAQGVRAKFTEADLTKAVLTRAEFMEADFTGACMIEANLERAGLVQARLDRAVLESCTAERVDLSKASLKDVDLRFGILDKALLEGADLTGADLGMANMTLVRADNSNFSDTKIGLTKFSKSRLRGSVFSGCKGEMGSFDKCDLREADCRKADMSRCMLNESQLEGADFRDAILMNASLCAVKAARAVFAGANLTKAGFATTVVPSIEDGAIVGADFIGADFTGADFRSITAPGSVWTHAKLDGTDFSWAKLSDAFFDSVTAKDVKFVAANLDGASFRMAKLDTPYFMTANLNAADFSMATVLEGEFLKANCYGMVLQAAEIARCDFTDAFVEALREDKDTVRV